LEDVLPSSSDIILEFGGFNTQHPEGAWGYALYMHDGKLYQDYGRSLTINRSGVLVSIDMTQITIPKRFVLEVTCDVSRGTKVCIDGEIVASRSGNMAITEMIGDIGPGGIGRAWISVRANHGSWSTNGAGLFTGKILNATVYRDIFV
jgi:hypothetical protein